MPQFLISPENISSDGNFFIDGAEAGHLIKVLRVGVNENIRLFDGKGKSYMGRVASINRNSLTGKILYEVPRRQKKVYLRLYPALIKKDRFELLLEKVTEIGVDEIVPVITERTVVKIKQFENKLTRWTKILTSAAKQCCLDKVPKLYGIKKFSESLTQLKTVHSSRQGGIRTNSDLNLIKTAHSSRQGGNSTNVELNLIAYEEEENNNLSKILSNADGNPGPVKTINLFIGPEGGFTPGEIESAKQYGCIPFTLGQNIFRAETAAIVACYAVGYEAGDKIVPPRRDQ
jgi:16S rRNA (uracil1498-N3)-methyltransferase